MREHAVRAQPSRAQSGRWRTPPRRSTCGGREREDRQESQQRSQNVYAVPDDVLQGLRQAIARAATPEGRGKNWRGALAPRRRIAAEKRERGAGGRGRANTPLGLRRSVLAYKHENKRIDKYKAKYIKEYILQPLPQVQP